MRISVVPDRLAGTTAETFLTGRHFLRRGRLPGDISGVTAFIEDENGRQHFATDEAIEAQHIGVKPARSGLRMTVLEVSHN